MNDSFAQRKKRGYTGSQRIDMDISDFITFVSFPMIAIT